VTGDGDPERRIAELERGLDTAWAEPVRTRLRAGWIVLGVVVIALGVGAVAILAGRPGSGQVVTGVPVAPPDVGPGPPAGASTAPVPVPTVPPVPEPTVAPGGAVSVAGIGIVRTISCAGDAGAAGGMDDTVAVSGVDNTVTITGHCARVDVSGVDNQVLVEEADAIVVSGVRNTVTYRTGTPQLSRSGLQNSVQRG